MVTKHSGSGGEISDSCITLPVERMEDVKEEEEEKAVYHYGWPHSKSIADLMTYMVVCSPRYADTWPPSSAVQVELGEKRHMSLLSLSQTCLGP